MDTSYRFHDFRLLPQQRQLLAGDKPVKLGARAFDLLLVLVQHRDRVIPKHELMDLVWPNLVVEENNLQVQVLALRKLLGYGAIATVPGRGYRFTLPIDHEGDAQAVASPSGAPSERIEPARSGNLPALPPQIIGRDEDLATLQRLLQQHGLVTVAGAGGIGKTRLAQGIAHGHAPQPADGVWWVDLSGLQDPTLVPLAVGQALGLPLEGAADASVAVVNALQGKSALLVLDNAEHLLEGVVRFAVALRERARTVKLLVTSQEVLHLLDEQVFRPNPLALPALDDLHSAQGSGAVALFVTRARQADPHFSLSEANLHAVVDICRRLDGIPLAIELAAARVRLLGVEGVRQRLGERFSMLTASARAVLRRHQTLRGALEWSHGLLTAPEQVVLRRLGVFVGGFTLEAAQHVAADEQIDGWDVLELMGGLVDKSMVVAEGDPVPRYRLLETARLYALERLAEAGETDNMLRCHAEEMTQLAEVFDIEDTQHGQAGQMLLQLDLERDNLLHALVWCDREGDTVAAAIGLRLAAALRCYWPARGALATGLAATLRALARAQNLPADPQRCLVLGEAALMANWIGQDAQAEALGQELLVLAQEIGFAPGLARAHHLLGGLARLQGRLDTARQHFEAVQALAQSTSDLNMKAHALGGFVEVLEQEGERARADESMEALLDLRRRAGDAFNLTLVLQKAARRAFERGETPRAKALLREALPLVRGAGSLALHSTLFELVARAAALRGDWKDAAYLQGAAAHGHNTLGRLRRESELLEERLHIEASRAALGVATCDALLAQGAALPSEQAFELAAHQLAIDP
jgi:predicted ATPase/DNA-binding winged helix-turn-helix (wHTH) protein